MTLGLGLKVTQSGSPAMSVDIATGTCLVPGTEGTRQGQYTVVNDASITATITASHPTLPRIDLITITIRDAQYSGAFNDAVLTVTAGTPASSPAVPAAPANSLILAQVLVGAAVVTIVNANITDRRLPITASGGIMLCTSGTKPTNGLYEGLFIFMTDTNQLAFFDGTTWVILTAGGIPVAPTTSASNGTVTSGTTETRDAVLGNYVFTAVAGRRYRAILSGGGMLFTVANDRFAVRIRTGGASTPTAASTLWGHDATTISPIAGTYTFDVQPSFIPGAGVQTLSVFYVRISGTGTVTPTGSREFYVEDIGGV